MKQYLVILAGLALLGGCAKPGTTVVTGPNGERVEVDQNGKGNFTIDDGKGHKSTMGTDNVSEADLGVPYYPGSTQKDNGNLKSDSAEMSNVTNMRETGDASQKVVDFYKDALTKAGYTVAGSMVMDDGGTVNGKKGDNDEIGIIVNHDKDKNTTVVMVSHTIKKGAAASPSATQSSPAPSTSP